MERLPPFWMELRKTWHTGSSLPAQALPNLKIKCLQCLYKKGPACAKTLNICTGTSNIQTTLPDRFEREIANFEDDAKPVLTVLTKTKG